MDVEVERRETCPPRKAWTVDAAASRSGPSCRARILRACLTFTAVSASLWAGQGGTSSQWHPHEPPGCTEVWSSLRDVRERRAGSAHVKQGSRI